MRLDLPVLENIIDMCERSGAATFFTVRFKDGTEKTVDVNMAWKEIHDTLRAIEHWLDMGRTHPEKPMANPTGQESIGGF